MTKAERKKWRAKWIERLIDAGTPFRDLAGISDHELWQRKNRRFGGRSMDQPSGPQRPKKSQMY